MINEGNGFKIKESKKRSSTFVKIIRYIVIIVVLIAVFLLGMKYNSNFTTKSKTTKLGLEDVGELVTQTAYVTVINDSKKNREFFNLFEIPFTESRQIFSYDIEVDASVDFSKISYEPKNDEIIITIPHSKIYKATLKPDSFYSYLDSESLFSRIKLEEHNDAIKKMEEQAIEDAKANGILEAGDNNAKKIIEGFIKGNGKYKDYKINYKYIGG